jgi:hypothetical protein
MLMPAAVCSDVIMPMRRWFPIPTSGASMLSVDIVVGGYGTNSLMAAMPLIIQRQRFFVGLMGLGVNNTFRYPNYFAMIPTGPAPNTSLTEGLFDLASQQSPKLETIALLSADAEFSLNPMMGAKDNAKKYGFRIVHESVYPLNTNNFVPFINTVAESECHILFLLVPFGFHQTRASHPVACVSTEDRGWSDDRASEHFRKSNAGPATHWVRQL